MKPGTLVSRLEELGSARTGSSHWVSQRLSGAALGLLSVWFLVSFATLNGYDYSHVATWLQQLPVAAATALLVLLLSYHSYLGVQVVVEDYVLAHGARTVSLAFIQFLHLLAASLGLFAVIRIAF